MRNIINVKRPRKERPIFEFVGLFLFWFVVILFLVISSVHAAPINPFHCVKSQADLKKIESPLQVKIFKLWVSQGNHTEDQVAALWEQSIVSARAIVSSNFKCKQ